MHTFDGFNYLFNEKGVFRLVKTDTLEVQALIDGCCFMGFAGTIKDKDGKVHKFQFMRAGVGYLSFPGGMISTLKRCGHRRCLRAMRKGGLFGQCNQLRFSQRCTAIMTIM